MRSRDSFLHNEAGSVKLSLKRGGGVCMYAVNCPMPKNCYSCPFFAVYEGCRFAPFEKIVDPPDISKGRPI